MNQCGERVVYDRCTGCATFSDSQQLTNCGPNKMLYYVRVPANITVSEFVSNPDLLKLYNDSNLELDGTGIAGRACLNDKTRLELQNLNATLLQIWINKKRVKENEEESEKGYAYAQKIFKSFYHSLMNVIAAQFVPIVIWFEFILYICVCVSVWCIAFK